MLLLFTKTPHIAIGCLKKMYCEVITLSRTPGTDSLKIYAANLSSLPGYDTPADRRKNTLSERRSLWTLTKKPHYHNIILFFKIFHISPHLLEIYKKIPSKQHHECCKHTCMSSPCHKISSQMTHIAHTA